jgi:hypothetical protein
MADVLMSASPRLKLAGQRAMGLSCKQGSKIYVQMSLLVSVKRLTAPCHVVRL